MALAALLTATAVPLIFLYLVRTLDLYGTGSPRAIAFSFVWGAVSVLLAFAFYRLIQDRLGLIQGDLLVLYIAPVLEELLKVLILLYLVRRPTFTYFVDGAIYGFAAGIGFAVFENFVYIFQNLDVGLGTALSRVLSTNLMHASAGAVVGIALGLSRFRRFSRRALFLLTGLLLAILLHAAFNRLVSEPQEPRLFFYAVGVGLSGVAFTALAIRLGLAAEKAWIAQTLGTSNRVTAAEITATGRLDRIDALLQPLVEIFGRHKGAQIEELLLLQAQLGILRKTRQRAPQDGRTRRSLVQEIDRKQEKMEAVRRSIGAYTMASLRMLFPEEGYPMWQRLEAALSARAVAGEVGHVDLFALLESRRASLDPGQDAEE